MLSLGNCRKLVKNVFLIAITATVAAGCSSSGGGGSETPLTDETPPNDDPGSSQSNASVTLTWTAPTQNEDGSALTDLAGYNLYYGDEEGEYDNVISIDNPSISTYVVDDLEPGTYYFVATSFTYDGLESRPSNAAVKVAA